MSEMDSLGRATLPSYCGKRVYLSRYPSSVGIMCSRDLISPAIMKGALFGPSE